MMSRDREPQTDVVGLGVPQPGAGRPNALLRAGDEDRQRVMDGLQAHYVAGRLTQPELEERIERTISARTFGDLDALTADLPELSMPAADQDRPASQAPGDDPRRRRDIREERRPGSRGPARKGFGAHAASYVIVMAFLVVIWLLTSPGGYFWPIWPMLGWGIGLASHGLATLWGGANGAGGPRAHLAI
jgi:hypothetical protein